MIIFHANMIVKGFFILIYNPKKLVSEWKMDPRDIIKVDTAQLRKMAQGYVSRSGKVNVVG
jgi:hypothetical protein